MRRKRISLLSLLFAFAAASQALSSQSPADLKSVQTNRDPGLTETSVRVGTLLPQTGPLAEMGRATREVLAAYFGEVNSRGGIHGRKIELYAPAPGAAAGGSDTSPGAALNRLLIEGQVFALVGGTTAGSDEELASVASAQGAPFVGPATLLPDARTPPGRHVFYLLPGVREQARALVNFAAAERPGLKQARVAVVYSGSQLNSAVADSIEAQAKKSGWPVPVRIAYAPGTFDAARTIASLREQGARAVFFAAPGAEKLILQEAERAGWAPDVFLVGVLAARDFTPESVPAAFQEKVFVAFPSVPGDVTSAGVAEFRALADKYKMAAGHTAARLASLAAAKVFVEGLRRAGRDLSREKLLAALEGLDQFETGVTPRVTFGPGRRVGAAGAHVVKIDTEKKQYFATGEWVAAQ